MEKLQFAKELTNEYLEKAIMINPLNEHLKFKYLYWFWADIDSKLQRRKSYPPLIDTGGWTGEDWGFYEGGEL